METSVTYYSSPLGWIRLAAAEKLQEVVFCEQEPEAHAVPVHPLLLEGRKQLEEYFSGERREFDLPLEQKGTAFQQQVWDLLFQIPYGQTISYQTLSRQYGDLKAIRAVAAANGRNNLAIIIPCHRVIGSNQSLTGYAGGLWRKKWLLEHEAGWHLGHTQSRLF